MPRHAEPPRLTLRRQTGATDIYYIIWREDGRRRSRSTGTGSRRTANAALKSFIAGQAPDLKNRRIDEIHLGDLLAAYAAAAPGRVVAAERIAHAIMRLIPFWAALTVADADEEHARNYTARRHGDGASDGTIKREIGVLQAALNQAVRNKVITAAPRLWQPDRPAGRADWLTRAQIASMVRAARAEHQTRAHLPTFILAGFYTGSRKSALLDLRWRPNPTGGHVDIKRRRIDFNPVGRKATNKRRAVIPIPGPLVHLLAKEARRGAETVISNSRLEPIKAIRRGFAMAATAAGAPWATPHTLRHSCITHMLLAGNTRYDVSKWCAISMTELERTYGHHATDYLEDAANSWTPSNRRQKQ